MTFFQSGGSTRGQTTALKGAYELEKALKRLRGSLTEVAG